MLKAKQVEKAYGQLPVLKGINLQVEEGEIVSIVGASGAGKSTLLHILGTLDEPDRGEVWIGEENITRLRGNQLAAFRNTHIGFIFQFHNLLPEFTAIENICIPAYISGRHSEEKVQASARELMEFLRIDHRANHKPNELSGGEQQRTAVARALINRPRLIFADEPSGNLDSTNASELHKLFFQLRDTYRQSFIIVTHNEELATMADRKVEIKDGRIVGEQEL